MALLTKCSGVLQHIVEFRLEGVPQLVKALEDLAQSLQHLSVWEFEESEESRDAVVQLCVRAYCSALRSAKLVRALDKVIRCLPLSYWSAFVLEMDVALERLLLSSKLSDVKTLSALLDHRIATKLSTHRHFHSCTSLLQDLLETCSHMTSGVSCSKEFQHYSVKLCIQVLHIYAQDVNSTFRSVCRDEDAVDRTSTRHRWNQIMTSLITLIVQGSTQETVLLLGTALVMVITHAPTVDMAQSTCTSLLKMVSCGEVSVMFAGMKLSIQKTASDIFVPLSGIIKGILVCCSKETLSQGQNPLLFHIFPDILQLCQGPSIHHYQAFSLLLLWYQKLDFSELIHCSSVFSDVLHNYSQIVTAFGSLSGVSVFTKNVTVVSKAHPSDAASVASLMLGNSLACIWPHWDSPVEGVAELVGEIFQHLLRNWQQAVNTGLFDSGNLQGQLMSKALSLAWYSKARYRCLKVLLISVDFIKVADIHRQLSYDLLRCMTTNNLAAVASDVYQACLQQIKKASNLGQTEGLQIWADVWMPTLLSGLTSENSVQMLKMCTYWLPSTLKLFTGSHQLLRESIEEHLRSSDGQSCQRWLFAWVSIAACARQLFHVPSQSTLTSRFLQESLLCADDDVRIEALKLVCTSLKRGEAMTNVESCLLKEFITANLKTDSAAFRQHMTSTLRKMFVRIRDSCLTALRNCHTHQAVLPTSVEFVEWLHQLLVDNLIPGGCYQRRQTSLALLHALLETFVYQPENTSRKGKAQESSDMLLLYAQEQNVWNFFSQNNFVILVCCLQDGVSEIQTQSFDLLVKYHTWPQLTDHVVSTEAYGDTSPTGVSPLTVPSMPLGDRACADIFHQALHLMSSPRTYENHSGMLMISLLISRCTLEHTWNSSFVCDELARQCLSAQHLPQPAPSVDTDTCLPRTCDVSRVLLALLDLLVNRLRSSLDAVINNLGRNYHIHCLHGFTQSVARVLLDISEAERKGLVSLSTMDWETRLKEIVSLNQQIINLVLEVLAGRQNLENCPSFAEMGVALTSQIPVEPDDDVLSTPPQFQLLLSWCWLNLKESCSCLGQLASLFVTSEDNRPHPVLLLSDIGQTFVKVLTTCRHRGAIEGSRYGLYQFCCSLLSSDIPDLTQIPSTLLQQILDSVSQNCLASSVTRRSAGLPIFIQTVLQAAHKHGHKTLVMSAVSHLYDIAAREPPAEHSQLQDLSQGHALHILKTIFSDASLAAQLLPLLSQMTILVVQGFDSPSWAIRNAATQLISTLVSKIFGQKSQDGVNSGMSLEVFSAQFPQLLQFLCEHLNICPASKLTVKPSTYIILTLLSQLQMFPRHLHSACCRDLLRDAVTFFMASPVYALRKLSGQAYVALSALDMADETLSNILQKIMGRKMKLNELHGWLMCVHSFMSSETISGDMSTGLLMFVLDNDWLLLGLSSCWLPVSTTLHIIQMALTRSQPDLTLLDKLWQLVQVCLKTVASSSIKFQVDGDWCLKHCLQTLAAIHRASTVLTPASTHQLSQFLLEQLLSSQDHLRQAALECLQATTDLTTNAAIQGAVLLNMSKETDAARLLACGHLLMRWALKGQLQLQACDFVAAGLTSRWPQLEPVHFIIETIVLGSFGVSMDFSCFHSLEVWSHQLLAYSQPTQDEKLRVLAARSLAVAGVNIIKFARDCSNVTGLGKLLTRILRASLQLIEDTEAEVRPLVSRFLCQNSSLPTVAFTWCYPALSQLLLSELCWSSDLVDSLIEVLYMPGQLSASIHSAVTHRQQVLFEPETTSCMSEPLIRQIWAYHTLQNKLAVTGGIPVWRQVQAAALCARDDLKSNMDLIRDSLYEFPVFNISCHEEVTSSLLGVVLLICLDGTVFTEDTQATSSHSWQELVHSLLKMPFLHPFLGKSTLKDFTVAVSRLLPRQLPSLDDVIS